MGCLDILIGPSVFVCGVVVAVLVTSAIYLNRRSPRRTLLHLRIRLTSFQTRRADRSIFTSAWFALLPAFRVDA